MKPENTQSTSASLTVDMPPCADCGGIVGKDDGPPDGWQLEDGRTVCHSCAGKDLYRHVTQTIARNRRRVRPSLIHTHGFSREEQAAIFLSFVAFMAIALAIGLIVELMLNNSP